MSLFSEFLKEKRINKGISQRELAEAIGYSSGQYVSNYERNLCPVPQEKLKGLIEVLELEVSEVINLMERDFHTQLMGHLAYVRPKKKKASSF